MCYECGPAQYMLIDLFAVGLLAAVFVGGWLSTAYIAWDLLGQLLRHYI